MRRRLRAHDFQGDLPRQGRRPVYLWPDAGVLEWITNTPIPKNKRCSRWPPNVLVVRTGSPSRSSAFHQCRLLDSGESLRAPKSTATLTAGSNVSGSLESIGALQGLPGSDVSCSSNFSHLDCDIFLNAATNGVGWVDCRAPKRFQLYSGVLSVPPTP